MWVYAVCFAYASHVVYTYLLNWPVIDSSIKNEENTRLRLRDAMSSCMFDEIAGI